MSFNIKDAVNAFLAFGFNDGDLISHDWLGYNLEINSKALRQDPFLALKRVEDFKAVLLKEFNIALQNVRGKGYRIVPPSEQAQYAAEEAARYITKGLLKASDLLDNTRIDSLTDQERRRHTDTSVRMAALSGMVSRGKRDVFALFGPEERVSP